MAATSDRTQNGPTRGDGGAGRMVLSNMVDPSLVVALRGRSTGSGLRGACSRCSPTTHVPPAPARYAEHNHVSAALYVQFMGCHCPAYETIYVRRRRRFRFR
ncbi:hypothetical protein EVAR_99708_1 [Eumeta japonica]|uniref:Uncharacterized protein n=1 Tax=Eumeta variegata TaxID=151549 RepID=A0A4C1ZRM9_EUMVA|nr:hypothetical protein EVAR_99708_1 [Eumeta japonica]